MTISTPEEPATSEGVPIQDGSHHDLHKQGQPVRDGPDVETAIVLEVTAALVAHPPRELTVIEVDSRQGVVTLKGEVGSTVFHAIAGEIASSHPGVETMVNALEIHERGDGEHEVMM